MKKNTKTLEICCYVVCLGAFGIFVRWMQLMLAYNDESLVDKSFWNVAVVVLVVLTAFFALRFIKQFQSKYYYLPHNYCAALKNPTSVHLGLRWGISAVMIIGSLLLLMQCEVDKNANFLRVLACAGILCGLSFGFALSSANRPAVLNRSFAAFLSSVPILFLAIWVVTIYKENSINPITWDYTVELMGIIFSMVAFFRIAGFAFGMEDEWRAIFFSMLGAATCIMNLADSRYIGEQIMFAATAFMQLMYLWIMLDNLKKGKPIEKDISV